MKKKITWSVEAALVKSLSEQGKTLQEIGDRYGVSKEMIRQVLKKYFPSLTREQRGVAKQASEKRKKFLESLYARTGRATGRHEDDLSRAMSQAFTRKKQNSKKSKWGWSLNQSDLEWPTVCPILGIELDWFAESKQENSPSFDRIDSTKGYEVGNVIICSWRANRIKNDGTWQEHAKIAEFLRNKEEESTSLRQET